MLVMWRWLKYMYDALSLTNKNETKCGLQNKNYAKMSPHFCWPKRDETKCYNVTTNERVVREPIALSALNSVLRSGHPIISEFNNIIPLVFLLKCIIDIFDTFIIITFAGSLWQLLCALWQRLWLHERVIASAPEHGDFILENNRTTYSIFYN